MGLGAWHLQGSMLHDASLGACIVLETLPKRLEQNSCLLWGLERPALHPVMVNTATSEPFKASCQTETHPEKRT
jgi:hypothetical protein